MLAGGCKTGSRWSCFGASSPADLEIKNPTERSVEVVLLVYSGNTQLGNLKLQPKETKVICLENEGALSEGLYRYHNQCVSKIKLSNDTTNTFNLGSELCNFELKETLLNALNNTLQTIKSGIRMHSGLCSFPLLFNYGFQPYGFALRIHPEQIISRRRCRKIQAYLVLIHQPALYQRSL